MYDRLITFCQFHAKFYLLPIFFSSPFPLWVSISLPLTLNESSPKKGTQRDIPRSTQCYKAQSTYNETVFVEQIQFVRLAKHQISNENVLLAIFVFFLCRRHNKRTHTWYEKRTEQKLFRSVFLEQTVNKSNTPPILHKYNMHWCRICCDHGFYFYSSSHSTNV